MERLEPAITGWGVTGANAWTNLREAVERIYEHGLSDGRDDTIHNPVATVVLNQAAWDAGNWPTVDSGWGFTYVISSELEPILAGDEYDYRVSVGKWYIEVKN